MLYFISDTHFYHGNIINLNPEVRFKGFEIVILTNLFKVLKPEDTLYHLGDFTWHFNDKNEYLKVWKALPGKKILVMGNHDKDKETLKEYFDEIYDFYKIIEYRGKRVLLSHYPAKDPITDRYPARQEEIREIYFKERCDILIHGHVHWNKEGLKCACEEYGIVCINANVEWNDYKPVSEKEVDKLILYEKAKD